MTKTETASTDSSEKVADPTTLLFPDQKLATTSLVYGAHTQRTATTFAPITPGPANNRFGGAEIAGIVASIIVASILASIAVVGLAVIYFRKKKCGITETIDDASLSYNPNYNFVSRQALGSHYCRTEYDYDVPSKPQPSQPITIKLSTDTLSTGYYVEPNSFSPRASSQASGRSNVTDNTSNSDSPGSSGGLFVVPYAIGRASFSSAMLEVQITETCEIPMEMNEAYALSSFFESS